MKCSFKYALLVTGGFLLFCAASCTKALKEKPFSFISPNNFYQSGSDAEAAINAVYN